MGFKKGDKVQFKEWNDMMTEFSFLPSGGIDCLLGFTRDMAYLCGDVFEVESVEGYMLHLKDHPKKDSDNIWFISTDMVKHFEDFKVTEEIISTVLLLEDQLNKVEKGKKCFETEIDSAERMMRLS